MHVDTEQPDEHKISIRLRAGLTGFIQPRKGETEKIAVKAYVFLLFVVLDW